MSTVVVAGGAGYVGSHTAKALLEAGYDVVIVDDLSAGHAEVVDRLRRAVPDRGTVRLERADIQDRPAVAAILREAGASAVCHFAAKLLPGESVRDPFLYYRANVGGSLALFGAMADAGVQRLVFSSTCATFGEPVAATIDETHPQRPINAYGETKLAVERALPHVERAAGIRWVALRYFNAAGADPAGWLGEDHEPEEHLIPRAIRAAAGDEALTVFGEDYPTPDGTCIRDYVHVADLADAHVSALARLEAGGPSAAYNLGTGEGMSVRQVIETVGRVVGRPVRQVVGARRPGDPARLVAGNALARQALAWAPRLGALEDIVRTAWRWHERHPGGYRGQGAS
jgi:UDP-glucose-4-epimerase GalE